MPPTLEELEALTPRIEPVHPTAVRPFWSVMIPTYNSGPYLVRTLKSVLSQDPGPDKMQIEVVDGCSTLDRPAEVVELVGKGRIDFHSLRENRGPASTINTCIRRARGQWVHILHGDDMVLPGFYDAYASTIEAFPKACTVVGQSIHIDEEDVWTGLEGPRPPAGGGILEDFVERIATNWLVCVPSVVVKRSAYEDLGGYCELFQSVDDWDMFMRLGLHAPVASVARPLSLYRRHQGSQTSRLFSSGANAHEAWLVVATNFARIDRAGQQRPADMRSWRSLGATAADSTAWMLDSVNDFEGRYNQARWAWLLEPSLRRLTMLLKSWLKASIARPSRSRGGGLPQQQR